MNSKLQTVSRYQLDLTTPGISPLSASERKHKRQTPNLRKNPRGRPQSWHRLCLRQLNFGFRASFTLFAVVAINPSKTVLSSQFLVLSFLFPVPALAVNYEL
jgi:hypothetical protein